MKAVQTFELGPLKVLLKTSYLYRKLTFSRDNRFVALSGRQETENSFVWEIATGKLIRPPLFGVSFLGFVGDSSVLMGSQTAMWDVQANQAATPDRIEPNPELCPDNISRKPYFDFCMALNPTNQQLLGAPLYTADYIYSNLGLWDVKTATLLKRFITPAVKYNNAKVRFSPDGTWFTYVAQPKQADKFLLVSTWDSNDTEKPVSQQQLDLGMDDFNFEISSDGLMLAAADKFYDLSKANGAQIRDNAFQHSEADQRRSKKLLSSQELMEINPKGGLEVYTVGGDHLDSLELEYTVKVNKTQLTQKLEPKIVAATSEYYAAADDQALLLWQRKLQ